MQRNTKPSGEDQEAWFNNQAGGRKTQKKMPHTDINRHINLAYFSNM
jgi:hypothetical protein